MRLYRATNTGIFQSAREINEPGNTPTYGVSFNGTGNYLTIPNTNIGQLSSNEWTVECFINIKGYGNFYTGSGYLSAIFTTTDAAAIGLQIVLSGTASSWTDLSFYTTGGAINQKAAFSFQLNTWYHVAITRTAVAGGTYYMFVNGSIIKTFTSTSTWTDNNWSIGRNVNTNYWYYFNGIISNFRVVLGSGAALYTSGFTVPFSPLSNIANTKLLICQSATFVDNSSTPSTVTSTGATISGPFVITGSYTNPNKPGLSRTSLTASLDEFYGSQPSTFGVDFTYNTSSLTWASTNIGALSSNEWTMEWFMYIRRYSVAASFGMMLWDQWQVSGSSGIQCGLSGTANSITGMFLYSQFGTINVNGNYNIELNTWYHCAITRTAVPNGNYYMFINGDLILSFNSAATWTNNPYVMARNDFDGIISNFRIVLGSGSALYTSKFTPPRWPLPNTANTKLLICQSSTFVDNSSTPTTITNNNASIYKHDNCTRLGKNGILYPGASYDEVTAIT